jgi:hypothetical protein
MSEDQKPRDHDKGGWHGHFFGASLHVYIGFFAYLEIRGLITPELGSRMALPFVLGAFVFAYVAMSLADYIVLNAPLWTQHFPKDSAKRVLLRIPARSREHLLGDIEEEFRTEIVCKYGRFRARCWLWKEVLTAVLYYAWARTRRALGLELLRRFHR